MGPRATSLRAVSPPLERGQAGSELAQAPSQPAWKPGDLGTKVPVHGRTGFAAEGRQRGASIPPRAGTGSCFPPSTASRRDRHLEALGLRLPRALGLKQNLFSVSLCISMLNIPAAPANIPRAFSLLIFSPCPGDDEFGTIFIPILPSRLDPGSCLWAADS